MPPARRCSQARDRSSEATGVVINPAPIDESKTRYV
jgi:hypothetical protein